jgi:Cys-rich protein (TIGR01571 family)
MRSSFAIDDNDGVSHNTMEAHGSSWSTSLFACTDSCICCCACVVPCVILAQNVHDMQRVGITEVPVVDDCMCCGANEQNKPFIAGLLYFAGVAATFAGSVLAPINPYWTNLTWLECGSVCLHGRVRGTIQKHMGHEDECCLNFCCAWWCYSCAMAQEQRELASMLVSDERVTLNTMASTHA